MKTLIIAEHDACGLKPSTAHILTGALKLGQPCHVLIMGMDAQKAMEDATQLHGVDQVILMDHKAFENATAEVLTEAVMSIAQNYTAIIAPATTYGKNFLPRVAALLDVMQISDVIEVINSDTFVRPIYAGNALVKLRSTDAIKVMTLRPTAFTPASWGDSKALVEQQTPVLTKQVQCQFVSRQENKSDRPELTAARVVVSGGRGLQNRDNFKLIEALADTMNGAIGASRAAVDAGYVPNDYQVGQTGKVVAPDLYFAIGISGAIQHLAGMKGSKIIVAINKDEEAPIFQIADYGLVGDLFEILPELTQAIRALKTA